MGKGGCLAGVGFRREGDYIDTGPVQSLANPVEPRQRVADGRAGGARHCPWEDAETQGKVAHPSFCAHVLVFTPIAVPAICRQARRADGPAIGSRCCASEAVCVVSLQPWSSPFQTHVLLILVRCYSTTRFSPPFKKEGGAKWA